MEALTCQESVEIGVLANPRCSGSGGVLTHHQPPTVPDRVTPCLKNERGQQGCLRMLGSELGT